MKFPVADGPSSRTLEDGEVNVPSHFARSTYFHIYHFWISALLELTERNLLLAGDFERSDDDIPLSAAGARTVPKAPAAPSSKKTTHTEDFHDKALVGDPSDDNADPETHEQVLAELSKSDDEMLVSMEVRSDTNALGARLQVAAEVSVR